MAFKMRKGSPMYRNFGIGGSPVEQRDVNTQIAKEESQLAKESPARQVEYSPNATDDAKLTELKSEISGYSKKLKVELKKLKNDDSSADLEFISMARSRIQEAAKLSGTKNTESDE